MAGNPVRRGKHLTAAWTQICDLMRRSVSVGILLAASFGFFFAGAAARTVYHGVRASIDALLPPPPFREPEMVIVPAGSFLMGSPEGEKGRAYDEGPQRIVTIAKPFAVGKFEVTFEEWDACVAQGGCETKLSDEGWGRGRRPAIDMSWHDAKAYVEWLSRKTGKAYRLLTEAEWEYAARAGTTTPYAFGDAITKDQVRFSVGSWGSAVRTAEVGSFSPNAFGLYDMHGNAWEWVEDCYRESYDGAPVDGTARVTEECSYRVLRGGSWFFLPDSLRSASRYRYLPGMRNSNIGTRIARTL